jgi:excisionase family DNA binding protein
MTKLDEVTEPATYSVPEAGRILGIGRDAAYEAARRGEIPLLQIGRLKRVPKLAFHRMLESGKMQNGKTA